MGSGESKAAPTNTKTEINTSLIQMHWESFGYGIGSLILIILFLGIMIICYNFMRLYCCQRRTVRAVADMGIPNWTPMVNMGSMAQIPWVPTTSPVVIPPGPAEAAAVSSPQSNQLMLTDALQRLHEERRSRLNHQF